MNNDLLQKEKKKQLKIGLCLKPLKATSCFMCVI